MEDVRNIAAWFLSKGSMTHKKLQKLCYYAQAWHCALFNAPLFDGDIEAWVHGPVIPALYAAYASYGWAPIPQKSFDASSLSDSAREILDAVYETYGAFSGDQLEALTHSEAPWIDARGDLKPWENCSTPISFKDMQEYYRAQYAREQND